MMGGQFDLATVAIVLRILFFVAFFSGTALAYYYRDRFRLRQMYVCVFFVCLLMVNVTSVAFPPVVDLHKFSGSGPTEATDYEIKLVGAQGEEILLDARAIEPVSASRLTKLGPEMISHCNESERRVVAGYLLTEAREYRDSIEADPPLSAASLSFPRDDHGYRWTEDTLAEFGELEGVRIYAVERTLAEDGSAIASSTETLVYEYSAASDEEIDRDYTQRRRLCS